MSLSRISVYGNLHVVELCVDVGKNGGLINRWMQAWESKRQFITFYLNYLQNSSWCGTGRICCRANTAAQPSARMEGWKQCCTVLDPQL